MKNHGSCKLHISLYYPFITLFNNNNIVTKIYSSLFQLKIFIRYLLYHLFFIIKDSAVKRPGASSHNRLFGEVERVPPTPKSYHKSNIPIGKDDIDASKVTNGNGTLNGNGSVATTNGNGVAHENGNAKVNGTNGHTNGSRGKYFSWNSSHVFYFLKSTE